MHEMRFCIFTDMGRLLLDKVDLSEFWYKCVAADNESGASRMRKIQKVGTEELICLKKYSPGMVPPEQLERCELFDNTAYLHLENVMKNVFRKWNLCAEVLLTKSITYFASGYVMRYSMIKRKSKYKVKKQQIFQKKTIR